MIWLAILLLAAAALVPLALVLRRRAEVRGGRDPALALHRAQLADLDRDLAEGRILPAEHATARLEVQRRLLHASDTKEAPAQPGSRMPLFATLAAVPLLALGLYLIAGVPNLPSPGPALEVQRRAATEEAVLIGQLRESLAVMAPNTDRARQGYILLGNVEEARGNDAAAASAWGVALQTRFDATLAARAAEASVRAAGGVTEGSAALFRRALEAAPPDAPWRDAVQQRLAEQRMADPRIPGG